jgi:large subunit ribosomal protein L10
MAKAEKVERVAALKERIEGSDALLLTEYRGLTVSEISELRRSLEEGGTAFSVVKNTLMLRAANDAAIEDLEALLEGPTAVAFVSGDAVAAAKKVVDAAKLFPALVLKGAYMDGRVLSAGDAKALADLDSREVMLSKIAGLMKGEMSRAASLFQAAQSRFVSLLEAYKEKLPVPEAEAAAEPEAPIQETAEAASGETSEVAIEDAPDDAIEGTDGSENVSANAPEAEASAEEEKE